MIVNICDIPHKVIECDDKFDMDSHLGMITYVDAEIRINSKLKGAMRKETICHEMVHGILVHLGYDNLSDDETFVHSLGNAITQSFDIIDFNFSEDEGEPKPND